MSKDLMPSLSPKPTQRCGTPWLIEEWRPLCGILVEEEDTEDCTGVVRRLDGTVEDGTTEEGYIRGTEARNTTGRKNGASSSGTERVR